jgi:hypothetical protein
MHKLSGLINPKIGNNNLIQSAYTHLHLKQCLKKFVTEKLHFTDTEWNEFKYFIKESPTSLDLKIKTTNSIHSIVLRTEQVLLEIEINEVLKKMNRNQKLKIVII